MSSSELQNRNQKFIIMKGFTFDLFNMLIATMLILSVPQKLTIENLPFNFTVGVFASTIIINCITSICMLILFFIELHREIWLLNTFDYSKRYDSLHLRHYVIKYPEIFKKLERLNKNYYLMYFIMSWIYLINSVLSSIVILWFSYSSYQTITILFSNMWTCWSKLYKGLEIGKESIKNNLGYSYYNTLNLSFNRLDAKVKNHISTSDLNGDSLNSSFNNAQPFNNAFNNAFINTNDILI